MICRPTDSETERAWGHSDSILYATHTAAMLEVYCVAAVQRRKVTSTLANSVIMNYTPVEMHCL